MKDRTVVVLGLNDSLFKFLSVFRNKKDASFYIHQHIIDEKIPLAIAKPIRLLRSQGNIDLRKIKKVEESSGQEFHLSVHPNRLYLKRTNADGSRDHLMEEVIPQQFKEGYRLHAIFTPPPPTFMEKYRPKDSEENIIFEWNSDMCPQISIYELNDKLSNSSFIKMKPEAKKIEFINSDGLHPTIALEIRSTDGEAGIWMPNCAIYGKVVKKGPISKEKLQEIIDYNSLKFDISSIPDGAVITDYKIRYPDDDSNSDKST